MFLLGGLINRGKSGKFYRMQHSIASEAPGSQVINEVLDRAGEKILRFALFYVDTSTVAGHPTKRKESREQIAAFFTTL